MEDSLKNKMLTALIVFLVSFSLFLGVAYQFDVAEGTSVKYIFPKEANDKEEFGVRAKNDIPDHPPNFTKPTSRGIRNRVLKPNFTQWFDGHSIKLQKTKVSINSDGFRDDEYSPEKPENTQRIIALGDSFTFGWGVNESDSWPEVLETRLDRTYEENVQVLNFGVWSYNTADEVEMLSEKGLKYRPDKVILHYHRNDAINRTRRNGLYDKYGPEIREKYSDRNISEKRIKIKINTKVNRIEREERHEKPPEESMSGVKESLENLKRLSDNHDFEVYLFGWPVHKEQSQYLSRTSRELNFTYINLYDIYVNEYQGGNFEENPYMVKDGHPNEQGHILIADGLIEGLKEN